ncbi:hypothetical protein ACFE04_030189 [Oxalis oulophora]
MAASTNPLEGSPSTATQKVPATTNGVNSNDNVNAVIPDNSQTLAALSHNSGISVEWTNEEQSILDEFAIKYANEPPIRRYSMIATQLKDKTVREVALRCRWMSKKENGKRRKEEHSSRKNKDRKERANDSSAKSASHLAARPNGPLSAPPMIPMDTDDGISFAAIGGVAGELLEQNAQMFNQVSVNFGSYQIHDNINLLSKARDNIYTILNDLNDMPEVMKQMPPLPVKLNDELANSILHQPPHQMKT